MSYFKTISMLIVSMFMMFGFAWGPVSLHGVNGGASAYTTQGRSPRIIHATVPKKGNNSSVNPIILGGGDDPLPPPPLILDP